MTPNTHHTGWWSLTKGNTQSDHSQERCLNGGDSCPTMKAF